MSEDGWIQADWNELLRVLRPGSRTVVYRPGSTIPVVDLARRGYRLMVVSESTTLREDCRRYLREQGLVSQLMGSHDIGGGKKLSLAKEFYELVLCFEPTSLNLDQIVTSLAPGGSVISLGELSAGESETRFERLGNLPRAWSGYRLV